MFNHHPQTLPVPFPFKGINTNTKDDISYGRFIQNILVSDNKTGALRYGTSLTASFPFDDAAYWREVIAVMPFLKDNGTSEKLVYVRYLDQSAINQDNIAIDEHPDLAGWCRVAIIPDEFPEDYRTFLRNSINDGIRIYIKQTLGVETEINVVENSEDTIIFDFPVDIDSIDDEFQIYIERALIARVTPNGYETITDQVDPLVIVSYVNFQGKLLIANGVDPVKVYDGNQLLPLKAPVPIPNLNLIAVANLNLTFSIPQSYLATLQADIKVGDVLTLVSDNENRAVTVTNLVYNVPANNQVVMTITVNTAPQANVKKILYQKLCPSFSYLAVVHKRLWAVAEGRTYKDKFRPPLLAMRAYYTAKVESIYDWFNAQTNQIDFINLSNNSSAPDNLEAITMFEGRTLFLGRETTQVFIGEDPTTNNDGQNITLPDFQWEQTLPVGVVQQTLFVEVPNNLIFLSKYGIVSLTSVSEYLQRKLQVSYQFSTPIDHYINSQLSFIETDRDFRSMRAFLYPYGRFLGFRIKYSCFIYQLNAEGAWVVFSENFAESSSILYDSTTQNLYLGMPQGDLLVYSDKVGGQSYLEYGKGYMSWFIAYNWTFFENTWSNTDVYIDSKTLEPLECRLRIYTDQDETQSINEQLTIEKQGVLYDVSPFGLKPYPLNETSFTHEIVRFTADSLMIELSGTSNDLFVFNKLFLAGGAN